MTCSVYKRRDCERFTGKVNSIKWDLRKFLLGTHLTESSRNWQLDNFQKAWWKKSNKKDVCSNNNCSWPSLYWKYLVRRTIGKCQQTSQRLFAIILRMGWNFINSHFKNKCLLCTIHTDAHSVSASLVCSKLVPLIVLEINDTFK